jgi:hypothetical protein
VESELIKLLLQGTPYGILVASLVTVWLRYQDTLNQKDQLHTKHTEAQQKLIDLLLSKVEK